MRNNSTLEQNMKTPYSAKTGFKGTGVPKNAKRAVRALKRKIGGTWFCVKMYFCCTAQWGFSGHLARFLHSRARGARIGRPRLASGTQAGTARGALLTRGLSCL